MLESMAPRVAPIVEHLATEIVPSDPPGQIALLVEQPRVSGKQVLDVADLERRMIETRASRRLQQEQGVVVGWNVAAITPHKCANRHAGLRHEHEPYGHVRETDPMSDERA